MSSIPHALRPTRCIEGRLWRHDPQHDDPDLETDIGTCPECEGAGCEEVDQGGEELPNCVWRHAATPFADNH
jgi:hypothetical protein